MPSVAGLTILITAVVGRSPWRRAAAVTAGQTGHSGYVDSITSRRGGLAGRLGDLSKMALRVLYAQCAGCGGPVYQACGRAGAWLVAGCAAGG
jgi:hypothetical protein